MPKPIVWTERFTKAGMMHTIKMALNAEILWHQRHPGCSGCGEGFEKGFICGLKQARRLVRKIAKERK